MRELHYRKPESSSAQSLQSSPQADRRSLAQQAGNDLYPMQRELSCSRVGAAIHDHTSAGNSTLGTQSLLKLQRQYGNRYVARVVQLSRAGSDNAAPVLRMEQSTSQAIQRLPTREGRDPCRSIERDLARVGWELYQVERDICQYRRALQEAQECERQREGGSPDTQRCLIVASADHYRQMLRESEARRSSLQQRVQALRDQLRRVCHRDFTVPPPVRCE